MSREQVEEKLRQIFESEGRNIVLWHDAQAEFESLVADLDLPGVEIVRTAETGFFELKMFLHTADPSAKFLIYSPSNRPKENQDWLLDCHFYGREFSADGATIIRDELGLQTSELRNFINEHKKFFDSKKRTEPLKKLVHPSDGEEELAEKMLQVAVGAMSSNIDSILLALLSECAENEAEEPESWKAVQNFKLESYFWDSIHAQFGYQSESVSLADFARHIFTTELHLHLGHNLPSSLNNFVLSDQRGSAHARIFLTDWREKEKYRDAYKWWSAHVEEQLGVPAKIADLELDTLVEAQTFKCVEREILNKIRQVLIDNGNSAPSVASEAIGRRRNCFWTLNEKAFANAYSALTAAAGFIGLEMLHSKGFPQATPAEFVKSYCDTYRQFDLYYRKFFAAHINASIQGFTEPLRERIEKKYSEWYLPQISNVWDQCLTDDLLEEWKVSGVTAQRDFFSTYVKPILSGKQTKRVAVIISDALRYEAADELNRLINGKDNRIAEIEPMLSSLPSYTQLGMASLLPNKNLSFDKNANVLVDGKPSSDIAKRGAIIESAGGVAVKSSDLLAMNQDKRREFISDRMLIYIFHDRIDATGDTQKSERRTFEAVEQTIDDLDRLVTSVMNSLNTGTVIVTADHGFVYLDSELEDAHKTSVGELEGEVLQKHKRYIIGKNLLTPATVYKAKLDKLSGIEGDHDVIFPKGCNRFNFQGGARFFHGGPMPQEVIIPVVKCQKFRDKAAEKAKTKKVGISPLHASDRITSQRQTFKFIQTELVTEKVLPVTVEVGFYDEENGDEPISDKHTLTFDATEAQPENREQSVVFTFKNMSFNSSKDYYLKIKEKQTNIELRRMPFKIRIMLADEFGGF